MPASKVLQSNIRDIVVLVEGAERKRNDGKTVPIPIAPSKVPPSRSSQGRGSALFFFFSQVEITKLVLTDPIRKEILERRAKGRAALAERKKQISA